MQYLTADLKNVGKIAKKTVEELRLGVRTVLRVSMDTQVGVICRVSLVSFRFVS